jgi:hypothetical protein
MFLFLPTFVILTLTRFALTAAELAVERDGNITLPAPVIGVPSQHWLVCALAEVNRLILY